MIKVGILGCANIAKRSLAPAFLAHPAFGLVAVASRSLDKATEFINDVVGHDDPIAPFAYDDLIASPDIDLIYCPLPTGLHYEWVKKALLAGKHVLCEKSLACNYAEVEDLVNTARQNHCFLMESFQFRFHPQNLYVKKLLADNVIGGIRGLDVKFGFPPFPDGLKNIRYSKELGGGALLDSGAYTIKASTYLLGHDLSLKMATSHREGGIEVDLDGRLWLERKDGVVSTTGYGFHNYYQCGYEIWGEKGKITTSRAFTAKADFAAEVKLETSEGVKLEKFHADHFAALLDYVASKITAREYETEYAECLTQSRLLTQAQFLTND